MGTKVLERNDLPSAFSVVYDVISNDDGYGVLNTLLLEHLSTSVAGEFADVSELAYFIHEVIQASLFINEQEYDLEAASEAYLAALGGVS